MPSPLELSAEIYKKNLLKFNYYQDGADKQYSSSHPNATNAKNDDRDPLGIKGKDSGVEGDTNNNGGFYDLNGNPLYVGSGKKALLAKNKYSPINPYPNFPI